MTELSPMATAARAPFFDQRLLALLLLDLLQRLDLELPLALLLAVSLQLQWGFSIRTAALSHDLPAASHPAASTGLQYCAEPKR